MHRPPLDDAPRKLFDPKKGEMVQVKRHHDERPKRAPFSSANVGSSVSCFIGLINYSQDPTPSESRHIKVLKPTTSVKEPEQQSAPTQPTQQRKPARPVDTEEQKARKEELRRQRKEDRKRELYEEKRQEQEAEAEKRRLARQAERESRGPRTSGVLFK